MRQRKHMTKEMMTCRQFKYILQVFTGTWNTAAHPAKDVVRKVGDLVSRSGVSGVIVGWHPDPSLYRKLGEVLHASGVRMLLWLPAFSPAAGIAGTDPALDLTGKPVSSPFDDEEAFRFVCPSSRRNIRYVQDLWEKNFSACGFDGVFLDRVRSQSFDAGVSGVLSCGCEKCRAVFFAKGVDLADVQKRYAEKQDAFFDIASFPPNGEFVLSDPLAQRFFDVKEKILAESVSPLIQYFKGKGLTVGLDLFAPLVSRFVGQNYPLLAEQADFIKPMLYLRTEAPAGIGYEYSLFEKAAPGAGKPAAPAMNRAFLETQLEAVGRVSCKKYPGIEVNFDPDTVRTDPACIAESLSAIRDYGFDGAVLSWDVLSAPAANLEAVPGWKG